MSAKTSKRTTKLACNACRRLKIKCQNDTLADAACARCRNLRLECVYFEHHRGRKLREGESSRASTSAQDLVTEANEAQSARRDSEVQAAFSLANILSSTEDDYKSPEQIHSPARIIRRVSLGPGGQELHVKSSVLNDPERLWRDHDLITRGIFTEAQAEELFDLYMSRQNLFIALLDPHYHTFDLVRATSPALFTAILAVSSKFVDIAMRDRYARCQETATEIVSEGMGRNVLGIGLLQAISLLAYWKESSDGSAWSKVGYAVRLGYELGLDQPFPCDLPAEIREARSIVAKERTWLQIYMFDRTVSAQRGKPCAMVNGPEWSPQDWYRLRKNQGFATGADTFLTATYAFVPITDSTRVLRRLLSQTSSAGQQVTIKMLERTIEQDVQTWDREWGTQVASEAPRQCQLAMRFHRLAFDLQWQETCMRSRTLRSGDFEDDTGLSLCTGAAIELLTFVVDDFGPSRMLRYVQDIIILGASSAGVWLFTHFQDLSPDVHAKVSQLFRSVATVCSNAAKHHEDPCAYLARLFIGFSKLPSRAVSRVPSPGLELSASKRKRTVPVDTPASIPWTGAVSVQDLFGTEIGSSFAHDPLETLEFDPQRGLATLTSSDGLFDISGEQLAQQVAEDSQFWSSFIVPG